VGVKVATLWVAFITTVPGTLFPVVSLSVKVSKFPAEGELIVSGSIGWLKVAVTMVPVRTLSLEFMLVGTFVAQLLGLAEVTVGSVAAPTRVPGETATPGSAAAKILPITLASSTAKSKATKIGGLYEPSNVVIVLTLSMSSQVIVAKQSMKSFFCLLGGLGVYLTPSAFSL
jgi:hypothetical protein